MKSMKVWGSHGIKAFNAVVNSISLAIGVVGVILAVGTFLGCVGALALTAIIVLVESFGQGSFGLFAASIGLGIGTLVMFRAPTVFINWMRYVRKHGKRK